MPQNYVSIKEDFSDLEQKMTHLIAHPEEAQAIADESIKTLRDRYLTPAAEACYYRKMYQMWAQVQNFDTELTKNVSVDGKVVEEQLRGQAYEEWMLPIPEPKD
jgi:hypothetical protein